jgi:hypothetical protein
MSEEFRIGPSKRYNVGVADYVKYEGNLGAQPYQVAQSTAVASAPRVPINTFIEQGKPGVALVFMQANPGQRVALEQRDGLKGPKMVGQFSVVGGGDVAADGSVPVYTMVSGPEVFPEIALRAKAMSAGTPATPPVDTGAEPPFELLVGAREQAMDVGVGHYVAVVHGEGINPFKAGQEVQGLPVIPSRLFEGQGSNVDIVMARVKPGTLVNVLKYDSGRGNGLLGQFVAEGQPDADGFVTIAKRLPGMEPGTRITLTGRAPAPADPVVTGSGSPPAAAAPGAPTPAPGAPAPGAPAQAGRPAAGSPAAQDAATTSAPTKKWWQFWKRKNRATSGAATTSASGRKWWQFWKRRTQVAAAPAAPAAPAVSST